MISSDWLQAKSPIDKIIDKNADKEKFFIKKVLLVNNLGLFDD